MPPEEVGAAYIAIRASTAGFAEQARAQVTSTLDQLRAQATIPIRTASAAITPQTLATQARREALAAYQPVVVESGAMGGQLRQTYDSISSDATKMHSEVSSAHEGIIGKFKSTLGAAALMGGGITLAYSAFSAARNAISNTEALAQSIQRVTAVTGLDTRTAGEWVSSLQARGITSQSFITSLNSLARVTAGATSDFAKAAASHTADLAKEHAEQVRVTADQIAYNDAVSKYGPTSHEAASAAATLASAQNTLQGYITASTSAVGTNAQAFATLGITQQQLQSVQGNTQQELLLISDAFQQLGPGVDRTRVAQQLFGRSYAQMLPFLDQGRTKLLDNLNAAGKYGATLSGPALSAMDKARQAEHNLALEFEGLQTRFTTAILPTLITVAGWTLKLATDLTNETGPAVHFLKTKFDELLQSPYGKEFQTIVGDVENFAGRVRDIITRDLAGPIDFSHLFDRPRLGQALPQLEAAAEQLYDKVTSSLFASGHTVNMPLQVGFAHQAQAQSQQVGAGLFPGQNFGSLGLKVGKDIASGILSGFSDLLKGAFHVGQVLGDMLSRATAWLVTGGGAEEVLGAAIEILNAFVAAFFDPHFWIAHWKAILLLIITVFPAEDVLGIFGRLFETLHLDGVMERYLFRPVIDGFASLSGRVGSAVEDFGVNLADRFSGVFQDAILTITAGLAHFFNDFLPRQFEEAFRGFGQYLDDTWNKTVGAVLGDLGAGMFGRMLVGMTGFIGKAVLVGTVSRALENLGRAIIGGIAGAMGPAMPLIEAPFHHLVTVVRDVVGLVGDVIHGRWQNVLQDAERFVNDATGGIITLFRDMANMIGDLINGRWSNLWGDAKNIVHDALHVIDAAFGGLPGLALQMFERLGRAILGVAPTLLHDAERIGSEIVHGIEHGISSAPSDIAHAVTSKVEGAYNDVKSIFHIGSPSRVFADQVGKPISDGIILGAQPLHDDLRDQMVQQLTNLQNVWGPQWHQQFHDNVGTPIQTGVVRGVNPLQNNLGDALVSAARGAINHVKSALGISSPSSVFAEEVGRPIADGIVHGMGGLEQALQRKIMAATQSAMGSVGGGMLGPTPTGTAAVGANQRLGFHMMLAAGWPASQWGALQALWTRESGWNQFARNPSSGAFGIPQELGHAVSSAYLAGDVAAQIQWGLDYIRGRYGSPAAAWAHETSVGWYQGGGVVPGYPGQAQAAVVHGGEVVFTPEQMGMLSRRGITIQRLEVHTDNPGGFVSELDALARRL